MGFGNRKGIFHYSLFSLVLCICLCGSNGIDDFDIFRSKHDIFTNLKCNDESGLKCSIDEQCNLYDANCVRESNCKYCICSRENKTTFITKEDDTSDADGVCSGDEDILPGCYRFSDGSFMAYLELGETGPKQTKINISSPSFTKNYSVCQIQKTFQFFQNGEEWKTHTGIPFLLKEIRTNTIELEINSAEDFDFWNGSLLKITIACEGNRGMTGNEERCVLFKVETLPRYDEIVIPAARVAIRKDNNNKLMDFESKNGNSLVRKGRDTRVAVVGHRPPIRLPQSRHTGRFRRPLMPRRKRTMKSTKPPPKPPKPTIQPTKPSPTSPIRPTKPSPTIYQRPTIQSTKPLRRPTIQSTKPLPRPTIRPTKPSPRPTIPPTKQRSTTRPRGQTSAVRTTQSRSHKYTEGERMSSKHPSQSPTPMTSTAETLQKGKKDETSKSAGKKSTAIAVTVTLLLVALALALGYLLYCRRRKRAQVPQDNYNDLGIMNHSKEIHEDQDRTYETLKADRTEVPPNQPGTSSDTYSYPDSNIIPNPTSSEQEYTYAKDTDFPKSSVNTKATSEKPIINGVVYQTLEQPGQPTVDDFYNYPDNTNTAKPSISSEQEYTYAKDTDVPRGNPNTKVATQCPANRAVYHTLEPEKPSDDDFCHYPDNTNITKTPLSELEYSYAKDTDFPRGNPDTMVATQDPANTAVYHTLEQSEPSDDDFYHYPDNTNITKPPSSELEYTYAKDTDFPRGNPNTKVATQDPANRAVYHTLEQPEQPSDDDFYHYPDNTNITKPPSSELEYTYAKDTEIPKSFVNTKTVPKGDSSPAASDALYHTPGSEYSYVKNTDILSIPLGTEQTSNEHSSPLPDNSGLYHTLEEPNPPQAPVYSTLEGPEDAENHKQVNDEGLNFSDHTYIDVIGDSNTTDSRN